MTKRVKQETRRGALIYVAALLCLIGIVLFFFPILGVLTENGELATFDTFSLLFGGECVIKLPSGTYSFYLNTNPAFIIMAQLFLLCLIACIFGKNSPLHIGLALGFLLIGLVLFAFARTFAFAINEGIPSTDIGFSPAYYLACACFGSAFIILIFKFVESLRFWRHKKALI